MIYTPEMMRTLARQHDEDSDTRAALMQAADKITNLLDELQYAHDYLTFHPELTSLVERVNNALNTKGE